jgi:hypothetical protein
LLPFFGFWENAGVGGVNQLTDFYLMYQSVAPLWAVNVCVHCFSFGFKVVSRSEIHKRNNNLKHVNSP